MKTTYRFAQRFSRERLVTNPQYAKQRGVVLFIALIMLVAMTMAGIALVRSVDTATLVAGNLGFRQSATNSGDIAAEKAVAWLQTAAATPASLEADAPSNGYYASYASPTGMSDLTGGGTPGNTGDNFDWKTKAVALSPDAGNNTSRYVIQRLCKTAGNLKTLNADSKCSVWQDIGLTVNSGGIAQKQKSYQGELAPRQNALLGVYRITVRTEGPRNTFSYVQAIVALRDIEP